MLDEDHFTVELPWVEFGSPYLILIKHSIARTELQINIISNINRMNMNESHSFHSPFSGIHNIHDQ